jgi:hypothetical protein
MLLAEERPIQLGAARPGPVKLPGALAHLRGARVQDRLALLPRGPHLVPVRLADRAPLGLEDIQRHDGLGGVLPVEGHRTPALAVGVVSHRHRVRAHVDRRETDFLVVVVVAVRTRRRFAAEDGGHGRVVVFDFEPAHGGVQLIGCYCSAICCCGGEAGEGLRLALALLIANNDNHSSLSSKGIADPAHRFRCFLFEKRFCSCCCTANTEMLGV